MNAAALTEHLTQEGILPAGFKLVADGKVAETKALDVREDEAKNSTAERESKAREPAAPVPAYAQASDAPALPHVNRMAHPEKVALESVNCSVRERLARHFEGHNERLYEMLSAARAEGSAPSEEPAFDRFASPECSSAHPGRRTRRSRRRRLRTRLKAGSPPGLDPVAPVNYPKLK